MTDTLLQDTRYAFRNLLRSPGFTAAAVLTLALGIGANTAIFSVIDDALFRPLPFPHPGQLADVFTFNKATRTYLSSSYPEYEDFRQARSFESVSAFVRMPLNLAINGSNSRVPVEAVTGNYFSMLDLPPFAGRAFRDADDVPGAAPVAMISAALAGSAALGSTVLIEDQPFTVVGIVPKGYSGTNLNWGDAPRAWVPLQATVLIRPRFRSLNIFHERAMQWLLITGRMKGGVTPAQAQAELQTIATRDRDLTAIVFSAGRAKFWPAYRDSVARSLFIFGAASGLVLLLACANLSNLLLSRAMARRREFAIRLSIGASRARVARQLLTESVLLTVPGFGLALGLSLALSKVMARFPNALGLPLVLDPQLDLRVLLFGMAVSLGAVLLFGLAPALEATRTDVLPSLKASGSALSGGGRDWFRNSLIVLQVALSMILLIGGGLFARSVLKAWSVDPGFRTDGLVSVGFSSPIPGAASMDRFRRDQRALIDRLGTAGFDSVALVSNPPLNQVRFKVKVSVPGRELTVSRETVGPDFFRTVGTPLARGRGFTHGDTAESMKVAVVNQALAKQLLQGVDAVGKTLVMQKTMLQIVGVARDSRYGSLWDDPDARLYVADAQADLPATYLVARTPLAPRDANAAIYREWRSLAPRSPLYDFHTAAEQLNLALAPQRMAAGILGSFGALAILLAAIGLYSVVAYRVSRRTREIGIRIAIGARPSLVAREILARSLAMVATGVAVGAALSGMLVRFAAAQVKGVSVYDAATFGGVALLLCVVAVVAAAVPARRAARIDPQAALRSE